MGGDISFFQWTCTHTTTCMPNIHPYLYVCMFPKCTCTDTLTHTYARACPPQPHVCIQLSTHIPAHFLFAWAVYLLPSRGQANRKSLRFDLGNRVVGAILPLFIFLNVLSAPYCQVLSSCNDNIAHSSFLQRSREISGPYSVLLEPVVSAF